MISRVCLPSSPWTDVLKNSLVTDIENRPTKLTAQRDVLCTITCIKIHLGAFRKSRIIFVTSACHSARYQRRNCLNDLDETRHDRPPIFVVAKCCCSLVWRSSTSAVKPFIAANIKRITRNLWYRTVKTRDRLKMSRVSIIFKRAYIFSSFTDFNKTLYLTFLL
jgi:hypothetical protein